MRAPLARAEPARASAQQKHAQQAAAPPDTGPHSGGLGSLLGGLFQGVPGAAGSNSHTAALALLPLRGDALPKRRAASLQRIKAEAAAARNRQKHTGDVEAAGANLCALLAALEGELQAASAAARGPDAAAVINTALDGLGLQATAPTDAPAASPAAAAAPPLSTVGEGAPAAAWALVQLHGLGLGSAEAETLDMPRPAGAQEAGAASPPEKAPGALAPEGSGFEILLQGFNWESHRERWWARLGGQAEALAGLGVTAIWLPPPIDSVSPEGYLPRDLYCLDSAYGSARELRRCVARLQAAGLLVLADAVLNHRCASFQDAAGVWNAFGGRLSWDARAVVGDDANFGGRGGPSSGERFDAAPNIDHAQPFVKRNICQWLSWLREHAGYDGVRLDFVKGFSGRHVADYMAAAQPAFVVGEYWDTLAYRHGTPEYNQDAHRQRTINWLNAAGSAATAFDVTTKGILHAVFERGEYWRLRDATGGPPGVVGWWPSRAVTFLENHDTGSTQGHWRFPGFALEQGYAYILTHPGTPCIFLDHLDDPPLRQAIRRLIALRRRAGLHCRSKVEILEAKGDVYAAAVDDALLLRLGPGRYEPGKGWAPAEAGKQWQVWECVR